MSGSALTHRRAASSWVSALAFRCSVVSWTVSVALSFASPSLSLPILCCEAVRSSASFRHTLSCSNAACFCLLAYTYTETYPMYMFTHRNKRNVIYLLIIKPNPIIFHETTCPSLAGKIFTEMWSLIKSPLEALEFVNVSISVGCWTRAVNVRRNWAKLFTACSQTASCPNISLKHETFPHCACSEPFDIKQKEHFYDVPSYPPEMYSI